LDHFDGLLAGLLELSLQGFLTARSRDTDGIQTLLLVEDEATDVIDTLEARLQLLGDRQWDVAPKLIFQAL
jgi:hypothetical protein